MWEVGREGKGKGQGRCVSERSPLGGARGSSHPGPSGNPGKPRLPVPYLEARNTVTPTRCVPCAPCAPAPSRLRISPGGISSWALREASVLEVEAIHGGGTLHTGLRDRQWLQGRPPPGSVSVGFVLGVPSPQRRCDLLLKWEEGEPEREGKAGGGAAGTACPCGGRGDSPAASLSPPSPSHGSDWMQTGLENPRLQLPEAAHTVLCHWVWTGLQRHLRRDTSVSHKRWLKLGGRSQRPRPFVEPRAAQSRGEGLPACPDEQGFRA